MDYTLTCKAAKDCHPVQKKDFNFQDDNLSPKKFMKALKKTEDVNKIHNLFDSISHQDLK